MKILLKKALKRFFAFIEWDWISLADFLHFNAPDFSWKVRWRMRYDRNPLFIELQDKCKAKTYAQKRGIQVADIYYKTDKPETIPFDSLPEKYFIKANHGSGWNILYEDGKFYNYVNGIDLLNRDLSKTIISREECIELCKMWLKTPYSKKQWAYKNIQPMIFVEEKLEPYDGTVLIDYRCFVFDGVVKVVNQDSPAYDMHTNVFVDALWNSLDLPGHYEQAPVPFPPEPEHFSKIIETAELLGKGLDFVRVDLFDTTKGILLSEMTIYPEGGNINSPTSSKEFNKWLGDQWNLPTVRKGIFS